MLYLKRKIDAFLAEWKANPDRKPLIVKGPRQVGKTESIKRFGDMNYQSVITINFVEEPKYKMITADGYKADDIIKNISRMDPSKRFIEGETLIFFDELQEFPEIATALKFFKIDGRFDVICSGSMLGINYRKIESNSVGYPRRHHRQHRRGVLRRAGGTAAGVPQASAAGAGGDFAPVGSKLLRVTGSFLENCTENLPGTWM